MTSEQRKAVEILNVLKAKRDEGKSILNDDDYFFLMSFIFGSPVYVPQVIPFSQPLQPIEAGTCASLNEKVKMKK